MVFLEDGEMKTELDGAESHAPSEHTAAPFTETKAGSCKEENIWNAAMDLVVQLAASGCEDDVN